MSSSGIEPAIFGHTVSTKYATASSVNVAKQPSVKPTEMNMELGFAFKVTHLFGFRNKDMSMCAPDYKPTTPGSAAGMT
jgi:hypothetical protein